MDSSNVHTNSTSNALHLIISTHCSIEQFMVKNNHLAVFSESLTTIVFLKPRRIAT